MPEIKKQLNLIKAFAFDVDGVFTNGSVTQVYLAENLSG